MRRHVRFWLKFNLTLAQIKGIEVIVPVQFTVSCVDGLPIIHTIGMKGNSKLNGKIHSNMNKAI